MPIGEEAKIAALIDTGRSPCSLRRSNSIRSEQSDLSSENRRVSFNSDVRVKRIPKSKLAVTNSNNSSNSNNALDPLEAGPFARVVKEAPPRNAEDIASEAARILRQLEGIQCSVSPTPTAAAVASSSHYNNTTTSPSTNNQHHQQQQQQQQILPLKQQQPTTVRSKYYSSEDDSGVPVSDPSSMRVTGESLTSSSSAGSSSNEQQHHLQQQQQQKKDNHLFGLHALNNLDIAVNGKNVNSMPSYHEIRKQQQLHNHQTLDSSGNSAEYSPPPSLKRINQLATPPKPPRKAPSASPPSFRRKMAAAVSHYSQPEQRSSQMVSSMMEQLSQDSRFRASRMSGGGGGMTSGDEDVMSNIASSYSPRKSPTRQTISPSRLSPSRTCLTDTEILRSPTEVLYAVSDKYRHNNNDRVAHSASQTMQSELLRPSYERKQQQRATSREDLLHHHSGRSNVGPYESDRGNNNKYHHVSRSLDRFVDDDKENAFKARIQVVSPDRVSPDGRQHYRKPYKTTINTATDNIVQYRGVDPNDNLLQNNIYQKNQMYRRPQETEHYKVPKNKAPVEYFRNGHLRSAAMATDSDHSSSVYYNGGNHHNHHPPPPGGRGHFNSTKLVRSVESRRANGSSRELDREGRTIRRDRGRTYSGCSTSPDREDADHNRGYSRPKPHARPYSSLHRSPSSSPTRPPRARSSPGRELISNMMRKVTNRREVERTPSSSRIVERTPSSSRNRDIKRVHNDIRSRSSPVHDDSEDRLARFTEYRGGGGEEEAEAEYRHSRSGVRAQHGRSVEDLARERGQSLPPGANIDSIRDFYKSSQYKSMYALPPSPSRPAPVLERAPSSSTLNRPRISTVRPNRVSISEGEMTDNGHMRRNRFLGPSQQQQPPQPPARRPSTKRQAPSPPGVGVRRVVSSDREDNRPFQRMEPVRRVVSSDRGLQLQQRPPQRKPLLGRKTSMGDALDSSYSESEGFNGDPHRPWSSVSEEELEYEVGHPDDYDLELMDRAPSVSHLSMASSHFRRPPSTVATTTIVHLHQPRERRGNVILYDKTPTTSFSFVKERPGARWTAHQSDIDSDYRRELATNGSGLHQEARGRDGGPFESPLGRSASSSAREEERRKVLEIEEERLRREREVQLRRTGNGVVNRSASRVSRGGGLTNTQPRAKPRPLDQDSQYSGHSSSSAMPGGGLNDKPLNRFDQIRLARVKRSTSNANNNAAAAAGVRKDLLNRNKKMPPGSSVTSSLNSSESEPAGNRSVYLHAACVADIPVNGEGKRVPQQPPPRALSAESRENLAVGAGASNLQKSKKISRSISLLAPWKPKPTAKFSEIHYNNTGIYGSSANGGGSGKPPRPPVPPLTNRRPIVGGANMQRDKKSASSSDLLRNGDSQLQSNMVIGEQQRTRTLPSSTSKVSRSVSMPKDTRLAGWFKKRKRV